MRDERNLQLPPGGKEAQEAISAYISPRTVALLFFHSSGAVSIGSAIAIRLKSYYFLATAAHLISNLGQRARIKVAPYGPPTPQEVRIVARSHPRANADDYDVAWLQVEPETAEASPARWLNIKDLLCGQRFDPYQGFLVQGYPASGVIVQGPDSFDLFSLGVGCIALPPDRGDDFLTLEYPPQSPEDVGLELPSPEGLSDGGGLWTLPSFNEETIWSPEAARLVALGRSYRPNRGRLDSTPIERWLSLVAQDFPDLREDIEVHLRESRPTPGALISPHFRHLKLQKPTIEDLVDVLEDRIRYWLLEPAKKLAAESIGQVAGFSLLLTYFEGIWIFIQGKDSRSRSREFFESAFVDVFRSSGPKEPLLKRVGSVLYEDARCGFFHDAMFRERIFFGRPKDGVIHITLPLVNGVVDQAGVIESVLIDIEGFYAYVEGHFNQLLSRLRDPSQAELRANFLSICRKKWDYEGDPRVIAW